MVDVVMSTLGCLAVRSAAVVAMSGCRSMQARWGAAGRACVGVQHGSVGADPSPGMKPRLPCWFGWQWRGPLGMLMESLQTHTLTFAVQQHALQLHTVSIPAILATDAQIEGGLHAPSHVPRVVLHRG